MADGNVDASRRAFLLTAAGATAAGGAGTAVAQDGNETAAGTATAAGNATAGSGNETAGGGNETGGEAGGASQNLPQPDYGSWFQTVGNYEGETVNAMNQETATVQVGVEGNGGNFAFGPPAIHVSSGTTVQWEWTGEGGGHNVVSDGDGSLNSDTYQEGGVHYEYTFDEDGIFPYICVPHEGAGMLGAVVVGTDYPAVEQEGPSGPANPLPDSAKSLGVATTFVMTATLGLAYVFIKYGGDYGDAAAE